MIGPNPQIRATSVDDAVIFCEIWSLEVVGVVVLPTYRTEVVYRRQPDIGPQTYRMRIVLHEIKRTEAIYEARSLVMEMLATAESASRTVGDARFLSALTRARSCWRALTVPVVLKRFTNGKVTNLSPTVIGNAVEVRAVHSRAMKRRLRSMTKSTKTSSQSVCAS